MVQPETSTMLSSCDNLPQILSKKRPQDILIYPAFGALARSKCQIRNISDLKGNWSYKMVFTGSLYDA